MVKVVWEEMLELLKQKKYILPLLLTAILSYGFMVVNPTIGIDDTASERFFQDGLEPYMGRWTLFLINRVLRLAEFAPLVTEFVGVIFLIFSVTLWCVAFKRIQSSKLPLWAYTFFSCIFLSAPILSEICTYYTHNGICMAYGFAGLGAIAFAEGMKKDRKKRWRYTVISALWATIAAGCYESMVIVYIIGIIMIYLLLCKEDVGKKYDRGLWGWVIRGVIAMVILLTVRTLIVESIKILFSLEDNILVFDTRGLSEMLQWVDGSRGAGEFGMVVKRYILKYYINALAYFPITMFVIAAAVLIMYCMVQALRHKTIMFPVCGGAILLIPGLMMLIEAQTTPYRASQYIPLVCGFAVLLLTDLLYELLKGKAQKAAGYVLVFLLIVCTFNQCTEMNKWFYVDYLKYEDAKNTMNTIAYDLKKNHDYSKPVIFVGSYEVPDSIVEDAGLKLHSEEFYRIRKLADRLDEHLKEKYYTLDGRYKLAETPYLSVLNWGINAFDLTNVELFNFWEMHGHSFRMETDLKQYEKADKQARQTNQPS